METPDEERLMTLDEFLGQRGYRNAWVTEPGFAELYVRFGQRYINGEVHSNVLDLANMEAEEPGKGAFTRLIQRLRAAHPEMTLFVENVLNEYLPAKLQRMGFTYLQVSRIDPEMGKGSYYLLPEKEERGGRCLHDVP